MCNCKKCGTPIIKGEYCSRCESQINRKKGNILKVAGGTGILILGVGVLKKLFSKKISNKIAHNKASKPINRSSRVRFNSLL